MRRSTTTFWALGTAVLAVLVAAGAWFLAIDPVLAQAAEDRTATEDALARNDLLELEITKLQEQATHLDEYEAQLAALRQEIPATGDVSGLTTYLQSLADAAGVTVTVLEPGIPQELAVAAGVTTDSGTAAEDSSSDDTADDAAADDTATTDTAGADDGSAKGMYLIGVNITTVGTYDATRTFLTSLQTGNGRLFLVYGLDAQTQDDEGASGGRPATARGDVELAINGYAYLLPDSGTPAADDSAVDEGELPVPTDQPNPFLPVG